MLSAQTSAFGGLALGKSEMLQQQAKCPTTMLSGVDLVQSQVYQQEIPDGGTLPAFSRRRRQLCGSGG